MPKINKEEIKKEIEEKIIKEIGYVIPAQSYIRISLRKAVDLTIEQTEARIKNDIEKLPVKKKIYDYVRQTERHVNLSANQFKQNLLKSLEEKKE
jgi:hypothetical protein